MSKPHPRKEHGKWHVGRRRGDAIGYGNTPKEAYRLWTVFVQIEKVLA